MDTLLWRFGHFIKITKNAKNTIFQFSTRFLKIFQSTLVGLLYLIKNVKPSSTRTYPKPVWLLYPRLSNSPRKVYPMWRDSRYVFPFILAFGPLEFFLFTVLVRSIIIQMYPIYFIMNHPKLKQYFLNTLREWSEHKIIFTLTPNFTTWKNVFLIVIYNLTMGLVFEYKWPKVTNYNNQIVPI